MNGEGGTKDHVVTRDGQHGGATTLDEIRRRLVSIHYALMEGPHGDRELQRRTRERLMELLEYVNDALEQQKQTNAAITSGTSERGRPDRARLGA